MQLSIRSRPALAKSVAYPPAPWNGRTGSQRPIRSSPIAFRQKVPDGSATSKAIDNSLNRWTALTRYFDDGNLPISLRAELDAHNIEDYAGAQQGGMHPTVPSAICLPSALSAMGYTATGAVCAQTP